MSLYDVQRAYLAVATDAVGNDVARPKCDDGRECERVPLDLDLDTNYSYGLYTYGLYSYGLYSYGLYLDANVDVPRGSLVVRHVDAAEHTYGVEREAVGPCRRSLGPR